MSDSSADLFGRADAILDAVLDLPPAAQAEYVEQASGGDPDLRREVLRLLAAHRNSEGFLQSPAVEWAAPLLSDDPPGDPGQGPHRVGPFRILRELGHGGMGRVYLGERDDGQFAQRAAIKLIRSALADRTILRRFREERRILAMLEHPAVARLLDGGITDDGRPWFGMEVVEGDPIDVYCDARALPLERRLDLVASVCEAVQYAHQHLVVHRDLKPSNILVAADGKVKLLDFGVAKLLDAAATAEDEPLTGTGILPMTPEYAAPEQVRGEPVGVAADVYALGVLLYRLITGQRPYVVRGKPPGEVQRIICEVDPPRPSASLGAGVPGAVERAARMAVAPERARRRLRGDLDAIVMKALRKEPGERYASAQALADDLNRYQRGHPVMARRTTVAYTARRFISRHRLGVAAAVLLGVAVAGYLVTITVQQARVTSALAEARLGTQRAEQVTDFMLGLFEAAEGGRVLTDTVTARELLTRGVAQARDLDGQPLLQAHMLDVIGRLYAQLGEYDRAQPLLEEALTTRRREYGENHPDIATSLENLAGVAQAQRALPQAIELWRNALALRRKVSGDDHPKTTDALFALALALHQAGQDSAAMPLFDDWADAIIAEPRVATLARAGQLSGAAELLEHRGETARAEHLLREALQIRVELYGRSHFLVGVGLFQLGAHLYNQERFEEAEQLLREAVEQVRTAYPDGHPELSSHLRLWGNALSQLRRHDDAEAALREALIMRQRFTGEHTLDAAMACLDLAIVLTRTGKVEEAITTAREGRRVLSGLLGTSSSMVYFAGIVVGDALRAGGRYQESEELLLAAYLRFERPNPVTRNWHRYALASLVRLYEAQGRTEEARRYQGLLDAVPLPEARSD